MINYIETPDGVKRPFKFKWLATLRLASELKVSKLSELAVIVQELPLQKIPTFLKIGFDAGAKSEGSSEVFSVETIENWLDDDFSIFIKGMEAFGEQFSAGVKADEATKAEGPGKRKS